MSWQPYFSLMPQPPFAIWTIFHSGSEPADIFQSSAQYIKWSYREYSTYVHFQWSVSDGQTTEKTSRTISFYPFIGRNSEYVLVIIHLVLYLHHREMELNSCGKPYYIVEKDRACFDWVRCKGSQITHSSDSSIHFYLFDVNFRLDCELYLLPGPQILGEITVDRKLNEMKS